MTSLGLFGYAAVAILFGLLSVLLLVSWRGRMMGGLLVAACLASMVWATVLAVQTVTPTISPIVVFGVEIARSAAWLVFLISVTGTLGLPLTIRLFAHAIWGGTLLVGFLVYFRDPTELGAEALLSVLIPGGFMIALAGLVLIEQLYRNSPADARPAIKYLAIGLGGMFAYDLYLYSEAALFDSIDGLAWDARGLIGLLTVPLIAVAAQRNPRWDLNIFVSRQVVFFSTAIIAVGAYLILMSLGGYYILLYGGNWTRLLQIVFVFGALLVLAILLFSTSIRARAKVFLVKHFFANKYDYREEWLRLIETLSSTDGAKTGETLIKALAQMVKSPGGFLWELDEQDHRYLLMAQFNGDGEVPDIPQADSLVEFMKKEKWLIDLDEYRQRNSMYGDLVLPGWLDELSEAWLIVPLFSEDTLRGIMCLKKPENVPSLNYEDRDLLKTAGQHIAVHISQENADRQLAESKQFDAYHRLTAYLMHDLKNLMAQQSLIVKNAEKHKHKPEFVDDAMATIANSVERMNKVMQQLERGRKIGARREVPVKYTVSNAVDRCENESPPPKIELLDSDVTVMADPERMSMVIQHLVRNAQQATPNDGSITVCVDRDRQFARISVADSGSGMTPEFIRDRLFKPFDSTKGSQGMGIGAHQVREFAREMGGELRVDSEPDRGTTIYLRLPAV